MKKLNTVLLIAFLLSSCAPVVTAVPTSTPTQTITPAPTSTQTPSPTPTLIPTPTQIGGGTGKLIFDYSSLEYKTNFPDVKGEINVFMVNVDGTNLTPITNMEGFNFLKDVSPDGTKALIVSAPDWYSKTAKLYLLNLESLDSEPIELSKGLSFDAPKFNLSAKWLDNNNVIYIGQGAEGFGIYIINTNETNSINIERNTSYEILATTQDKVFWSTQVDKAQGNRHFYTNYLWFTNLDGSDTEKLTYNGKQIGTGNFISRDAAFSLDGTKVAWMESATATSHHNYLHIASVSDTEHPLSIDLITSGVDLKWRLNGKSILVFDWRSVPDSDKSSSMYGFYEISAESGTVIKNYHLRDEIMGSFGDEVPPMQCSDISLDGQLLPCLIFEREKDTEGRSSAKLFLLNLETAKFSEVSGVKFLFFAWNSRTIIWVR